MLYHLDFYGTEELTEILSRSAELLELRCEEGTLELIADRSRGTPRVANRLLKRVRDYAQVKGSGILSADIVENSLKMEQIDSLGLDELDRSFLRALINVYNGGPAGIEAIAATLGEERDTLEDVVETLLGLDQWVTGLDDFSTGSPANLDDVRAEVGEERWARFTFVEGDIRDPTACVRACEGADYLLHQAALGSVPIAIETVPLNPVSRSPSGVLAVTWTVGMSPATSLVTGCTVN